MRYDDDDLDDLRYNNDDDDQESDNDDDYRSLDDDDDDEEDDDESLDSSSFRRTSNNNPPRPSSGLPGPGSLRSSGGNQPPPANRFNSGTPALRPGSPLPPAKPDPFNSGSSRPASPSPFNSSDKRSTGSIPSTGAKPPTGPLNSGGAAKPPASPMSPSRPSPTYGSSGNTGSGGSTSGGGNFSRPQGQGQGGNNPVSRPPFGSSSAQGSPFGGDRGDTGPLRSGSDRSDTGAQRSTGESKPASTSPFSQQTAKKVEPPASPSKPADAKKDEPAKPAGGGFMSRMGNLASSLPIGKKPDAPADGKPADAKKDAPASAGGGLMSRMGGLASNLPLGKKPDALADGKPADAKKDAPASAGGGFMSRVGGLASSLPLGKKPDAPVDGKPADGKKDEPAKPAGGGFMSRMGNIASSLPIGKKPAAPADAKKDEPAKPAVGFNSPSSSSSSPSSQGSAPRPGSFGGSSSNPSSQGSNAPKPSPFGGSSSSSSSSPYSASNAPDKRSSSEVRTSPSNAPAATGVKFGAAGKKEEPADAGKKPAVAAANAPAQRQSPLGMFRGVLGRNPPPATEDPKTAGKGDKKADPKGGKTAAAQTASPASAIMGRFRRVLGVSEAPTTKGRGSRIPQTKSVAAEEGGLTLDNWLDIAGVAFTVGSLVLFFSALSSEKAAIGVIHHLIGQLFGWGALAVPLVMFTIGMWLIVRHFGDEAPVIDPIRVTGFVLAFLTLLLLFQYIDSFSYREVVPNSTIFFDLLKKRIEYSWQVRQQGGGFIGATLYLFILTNVGEVAGVFIVIFVGILSVMLITRRTASEMAVVSISLWRSNRDRLQQRAIAKRVKRQMAEVQAAELAAQQPQIRIEAPMPQALPAGAQAALPAPSTAPQIRFNRGALPEAVSIQRVAQANATGGAIPYPTPIAQDNEGSGLFGRLRRGNRDAATSAPVAPEGGRGWFNRGGNTPALPAIPTNPLPHDDDMMPPTTAQPAASMGRSPVFNRPNGNGTADAPASPPQPPSMPGMPSNPTAAPVYTASAVESEALPPRPPAMTPPAASTPTAPETDARQERINAIRSGQFAPPSVAASAPAPEDMATAPSHLPSVQGRAIATPYQEPLSIPPAMPLSQPVVSAVQSTRNRTQWRLPDARTLLAAGSDQEIDRAKLLKQAKLIEDTLNAFDSPGRVVEVNTGPVITQFGVEPGYLSRSGKQQRVKVGAIAALNKDLQLALGAKSIRMEAPVPGKGYVGIEVPNDEPALVSLRDVMDSPGFAKHKSPLAIALGQSVSGVPISADLASMPHVLIAGTTGSGKSVCVNAIIASILVRHTPEEVRFIMVDPKRVELTGYNGIPHLVAPVVVELERIVGVLKWVTREMDERYRRFSEAGARNIEDFNKHRDPIKTDLMPYIVVIIDELADLMMLAPEETERTITRIAALARATGIHLVLATQRPSVDVVTGLIKANFPARIAFAVASSVDSRVILDQPGAERLLGRGDMLYLSGDSPAPLRLQGVFVSDMEIQNVVRFWKMQAVENPDVTRPAVIFTSSAPSPIPEGGMSRSSAKQAGLWTEQGKHPTQSSSQYGDTFDDDYDDGDADDDDVPEGDDDLYERAVDMVQRLEKASVSLLQRKLRIGYTRAARLIDVMEERGVVGKAKDGSSKPRDVLPPK